MKNYYCDLHIHTKHSDGERSVQDLLKYANQKNLRKLSITDHDCVDAYFELENENVRKIFNGEILIGCEFVCVVDSVPIEVLGYGFDYKKIKHYLNKFGFPQEKLDRIHAKQLVDVCTKFDIEVDFNYDRDFLDTKSKNKYPLLFKLLQNNEKFVEKLNKVDPILSQSASKFLRFGLNNPLSPIYQNDTDSYPKVENVIDQIHNCGGLCFVAHPYQYGLQMDNILEFLKDKVDGVECYHFTVNSKQKNQKLLDFCKKNHLMISGGSDYHYIVDSNHMKDNLGKYKVPECVFDEIVKKCKYEKPLI